MSAEALQAPSIPPHELPQEAAADAQRLLPAIAGGNELQGADATAAGQQLDVLVPTRLLTPEEAAAENARAEGIISAEETARNHGHRVELIGDNGAHSSDHGHVAGARIFGEGPRGETTFPVYPLLRDVPKINAAALRAAQRARVPEVKALDEGAHGDEGAADPGGLPLIGGMDAAELLRLAREREAAAAPAGDGPGDGGGEGGGPGGPGGPGDGGGPGAEGGPASPERIVGLGIDNEKLELMVKSLLGENFNFKALAERLLENGERQKFLRPSSQAEFDAVVAKAWKRIAENYDNPDVNIDGMVIQGIMDPNNTNNPVDQLRVMQRARAMFEGYQTLSASLEFNGTEQLGSRQVPIFTNHNAEQLDQVWTYLATRLTNIDSWTDRARSTRGLTDRLNSTFYMPKGDNESEWIPGPLSNIRFFDEEGRNVSGINLTAEEIRFLRQPTFEAAHEVTERGEKKMIPNRELQPGFAITDAEMFFKLPSHVLLSWAHRSGRYPIHHASRMQRIITGDRSGHDPGVRFIDTLIGKIRDAVQQSNLTDRDRQLIARLVPNTHGGTTLEYFERAKHGIGALQMLGMFLEQLDSGDAQLAQDEEKLSSSQRWNILRQTHEAHMRTLREAHQAGMRAEREAIAEEVTALTESVAGGHAGEPAYDRAARRLIRLRQARNAQVRTAGDDRMKNRRIMLNLGARTDWRRRYEDALAAAAHPVAP